MSVHPSNPGAPALGQKLGNCDEHDKALFSGMYALLYRGQTTNAVRFRQYKKGQRRCYCQKGGQSDKAAPAYELRETARSRPAAGARVGSLGGLRAARSSRSGPCQLAS